MVQKVIDPLWKRRALYVSMEFLAIHYFLVTLILKRFFLLSRLYLLVESLANLRSPANGTYTTIDWSEYLLRFSGYCFGRPGLSNATNSGTVFNDHHLTRESVSAYWGRVRENGQENTITIRPLTTTTPVKQSA